MTVFLSLQFELLAYMPVLHICDQEGNHVSASFIYSTGDVTTNIQIYDEM
jgi:hypothetical protein